MNDILTTILLSQGIVGRSYIENGGSHGATGGGEREQPIHRNIGQNQRNSFAPLGF